MPQVKHGWVRAGLDWLDLRKEKSAFRTGRKHGSPASTMCYGPPRRFATVLLDAGGNSGSAARPGIAPIGELGRLLPWGDLQ